MKKLALLAVTAISVAACSDGTVGPSISLESAPTVRLSHMDAPGASTADDLCGGLSPCDAYDYRSDGSTGFPGVCFVPNVVNNHLGDPACSAPFVPGLDGLFQLAVCEVAYTSPAVAPTIVSCEPPSSWRPLVQNETGEFYTADLRWRRSPENQEGDTFRAYVVSTGGQHLAHRDYLIDPNGARPLDDYLRATGYNSNETVKVRFTQSFECVYEDSQENGFDDTATCLITGGESLEFDTNEQYVRWDFPFGNPPFLFTTTISECESLTDVDGFSGNPGNALVDVRLAGCKITGSSDDIETLLEPAILTIDLLVPGDPFPFGADARFNVLQADANGVIALAPVNNPGWYANWPFGATTNTAMGRLLGWGWERLGDLAALLGPEPVHAWPLGGAGGSYVNGWSDWQAAYMVINLHGNAGGACDIARPSCVDVGSVPEGSAERLVYRTTAPSVTEGDPDLLAAGTRIHIVGESGTVACPAAPEPGQTCVAPGQPDNSTTPASIWTNYVVVTGTSGTAAIDFTPVGQGTVHGIICGGGVAGTEPNPPGEPGADGIWGTRTQQSCINRVATKDVGFHNGPFDGTSPFEPVNNLNPVAIYGRSLSYEVSTCPTINIDGQKGASEWVCADVTGFKVKLSGPNPTADNAWIRTYNDGQALYVSLEVVNSELGNKAFVNVVDTKVAGSFVEQADDDVLVVEFPTGGPGVVADYFYTQACVGNNGNNLCGSADTQVDLAGFALEAAALLNGAGSGRAFYEFKRPFGADASPGAAAEDLFGTGFTAPKTIGLRVTVTQGQGGGKGGFALPSAQPYLEVTLD